MNTEKHLFSVLLSVYNKEYPSFLDQALLSLYNQTLRPSEVVIVKDGILSDELNNIIDQWSKKWSIIKSIQLANNVGLGEALKIGCNNCSYEIIARMDSDDLAMKERFEKQLKFLDENPGISVVGSWISEFEISPELIKGIRKLPTEPDRVRSFAKFRDPLNHMTVVFRKSKVIEAGGYIAFYYNEDYYLWVRLLMNNSSIANIPECLVNVRVGKEMLKRRGGFKYLYHEIKLEWIFYKIGFINLLILIYNVLIRIVVRLSGVHIRFLIYKYLLRVKYLNK